MPSGSSVQKGDWDGLVVAVSGNSLMVRAG